MIIARPPEEPASQQPINLERADAVLADFCKVRCLVRSKKLCLTLVSATLPRTTFNQFE